MLQSTSTTSTTREPRRSCTSSGLVRVRHPEAHPRDARRADGRRHHGLAFLLDRRQVDSRRSNTSCAPRRSTSASPSRPLPTEIRQRHLPSPPRALPFMKRHRGQFGEGVYDGSCSRHHARLDQDGRAHVASVPSTEESSSRRREEDPSCPTTARDDLQTRRLRSTTARGRRAPPPRRGGARASPLTLNPCSRRPRHAPRAHGITEDTDAVAVVVSRDGISRSDGRADQRRTYATRLRPNIPTRSNLWPRRAEPADERRSFPPPRRKGRGPGARLSSFDETLAVGVQHSPFSRRAQTRCQSCRRVGMRRLP